VLKCPTSLDSFSQEDKECPSFHNEGNSEFIKKAFIVPFQSTHPQGGDKGKTSSPPGEKEEVCGINL